MRRAGGRIDFYSDLRSCHNAYQMYSTKVVKVRDDSFAALPDTDSPTYAEVDLLWQSLTINPKKATLPRDKKIYWSDLLGAVR